MSSVFVTGGSGFVGTRLVRALAARGHSIILLDRSGSMRDRLGGVLPAGAEIVPGELLQPETYAAALRKADVVLHLAAATGRATAQEHVRVNDRGTATLVEQCRRAGVERLLFVSSIAAKFPDTRGYAYARAKQSAEDTVRRSGLRFTILRPTIILGPGSPILAALEKLAALPVVPIFGSGRALVQPIYVDDLVAFVLSILDQDRFDGETLELGGPASLTIEDLIQSIRRFRSGAHGRSVHIPLGLVLPMLRAAESAGLGSLLPVNAGQLSSFRFDGSIDGNPLHDSMRPALRDVPAMLALSVAP